MLSKVEELKLIARCLLADDREAFGALVEAYQPQVRRFFMNLTCGNASLTDDLAQETFVKAYLNLRSFKGVATFGTWLYRIGYNVFYSEMRRRHEYSLSTTQVPPQPAVDPVASQDAAMTVQAAIATLGHVERTIVTLHYIEDQPVGKIATIMQLPTGTIKSHLHRARQHLALILGEK